MAAVTVRALKPFAYRDHTYNRGDFVTFENPAEALAKARQGYVSLDRAYNARAMEPEPTPQPQPEPELQSVRRRYRRRDLKADE